MFISDSLTIPGKWKNSSFKIKHFSWELLKSKAFLRLSWNSNPSSGSLGSGDAGCSQVLNWPGLGPVTAIIPPQLSSD